MRSRSSCDMAVRISSSILLRRATKVINTASPQLTPRSTSSHASYSFADARFQAMKLSPLDPPSILPLAWCTLALFRAGCGTVWKFQSKAGFPMARPKNSVYTISRYRRRLYSLDLRGVSTSGSLTWWTPASTTATVIVGSSLRRAATTRPAVPPPASVPLAPFRHRELLGMRVPTIT